MVKNENKHLSSRIDLSIIEESCLHRIFNFRDDNICSIACKVYKIGIGTYLEQHDSLEMKTLQLSHSALNMGMQLMFSIHLLHSSEISSPFCANALDV